MKTVGSVIQRARERAGFSTQRAFADAWEKDQSFVSRVEKSQTKETLPPYEMHRLRDLLGVRVVDLLTASGYELEDMQAGEPDPDIAELTEHARLVDWQADPSRLPVLHAILETWSRFDRDSLRLVAEPEPDYNE